MQKKTETESVKTEQPVKMNFFEALNLLRSENSKLMKVAYISEDNAQEISGHLDFSTVGYDLNGEQQKSVPARNSKQQSKIFLCFCILN